jgi:hypothetical protein
MNLTDLHRRLLRDVLDVGAEHGFVITGGYAVQAHGLVNRLSRDLDVATQSHAQMETIAAALADGLTASGWARAWSDDIAERISEQVNEGDLP